MRSFVGFAGAALVILSTTLSLRGAEPELYGDWREPGGSVIRIAPCGAEVCATIMSISPDAPVRMDVHNPDPSRQNRALCGLVIGSSFHLNGDDRASNGTLYDPRTGRTYHGEMNASGGELHLRGYVGMRMFGRTQTWTRAAPVPPCTA